MIIQCLALWVRATVAAVVTYNLGGSPLLLFALPAKNDELLSQLQIAGRTMAGIGSIVSVLRRTRKRFSISFSGTTVLSGTVSYENLRYSIDRWNTEHTAHTEVALRLTSPSHPGAFEERRESRTFGNICRLWGCNRIDPNFLPGEGTDPEQEDSTEKRGTFSMRGDPARRRGPRPSSRSFPARRQPRQVHVSSLSNAVPCYPIKK